MPVLHDSLALKGLKYADLLGKPLSKGLYRQLPDFDNSLFTIDEADNFHWETIVHGKINWCPPECEVETLCRCEGSCRRRGQCRVKRGHQHLLLGADESLYRGAIYCRFTPDDDYPMRLKLWRDCVQPVQDEQELLRKEEAAYRQRCATPGWWSAAEAKVRTEEEHTRATRQARLQTLLKTERELEAQARQELHQWLLKALEALPVILLRG